MPHHVLGGHHGGSPYPFRSDLSSTGLRPAACFDVWGIKAPLGHSWDTFERFGLAYDGILAALLVENRRCDPPLSEGEVEAVAPSISKYDPQATPLLDLGADDESNALAVKALFGDRFLYCPAYGWLHFNGRYWQHEGAVAQLERATIEALKTRQTQAVQANRPDIVAAARPSATHMQAVITLLRSQVQADVQEFDASPDHVNAANGGSRLANGDA